jgi:hypothetical protein
MGPASSWGTLLLTRLLGSGNVDSRTSGGVKSGGRVVTGGVAKSAFEIMLRPSSMYLVKFAASNGTVNRIVFGAEWYELDPE